MVPRIVVVLELGTNLLCQVDGHIALQQIMYDEVRMLIVGCNLDRKKTCLLVHLGGKVGRMVEQTQNSPIVGVVLEGEEQGNDSQIISIGTIGRFNNGNSLEVRYSHGKINRDSLDQQVSSQHSISPNGGQLRTLSARWRRTLAWGELEFSGRYTDDPVDQYGRHAEKLRVVASATYDFD